VGVGGGRRIDCFGRSGGHHSLFGPAKKRGGRGELEVAGKEGRHLTLLMAEPSSKSGRRALPADSRVMNSLSPVRSISCTLPTLTIDQSNADMNGALEKNSAPPLPPSLPGGGLPT